MDELKRLDFGQVVDKIFWGLITATAVFVATKVNTLTDSVSQLNSSVAVIIERTGNQQKQMDALQSRVVRLEETKH
jgi:cell division protein FtsL